VYASSHADQMHNPWFSPPAGDAIRAQVKTIRDAAKSARTTLKSLRKK
jgi:hypothetical protein